MPRLWWRSLVLPARNEADELNDVPPFPERVWRVAVAALHSVFGILVILAALDVALSHPEVPWGRVSGLTALGVLVLAYVLAGRIALTRDADRYAVCYLSALTVCIGVLAWSLPDTLFILFIAYPQVWFIVERPVPGVFWTVLLFVSGTVGIAVNLAVQHAHVFGAVSGQLVAVGFSLILGIWTNQVLDQNRRQSVLIAELQRKETQLALAHHERGVLAERERLARDVHDTLAQGYTSIVLLSQTALAALAALPSDTATARDRVELIEEVARDNLREARAVIAALSPVEVDGTTLREALTRLVDRFRRETGVPATLGLDTDPTGLRRDEEVVLLRAAQEALNNARRHAAASTVSLHLERDGDRIAVRVTDDGVGIADPGSLGSGLNGLRRRVEQIGGSLDISSSLGSGTSVVARVTPQS